MLVFCNTLQQVNILYIEYFKNYMEVLLWTVNVIILMKCPLVVNPGNILFIVSQQNANPVCVCFALAAKYAINASLVGNVWTVVIPWNAAILWIVAIL